LQALRHSANISVVMTIVSMGGSASQDKYHVLRQGSPSRTGKWYATTPLL
jgi:hypothetical protein